MGGKMKIRFVLFPIFFAVAFLFIYLACKPYTVKFSKDFYYDYESDSIFGNGDLVDIPPDIIDYACDKKFVIVRQHPKLVYIDYDCNSDYSYKAGLDENYYWLIVLKEKKVFGPMLFEDFNYICEEKNVGLKFKK